MAPTPVTSSTFRGSPPTWCKAMGVRVMTWAFNLIHIRFTSAKQLNSFLKALVLALTEFVWDRQRLSSVLIETIQTVHL